MRACGHRRIVALRDGWGDNARAAAADPAVLARWPVGTRTPLDGNTIAALVQRSGQPARMDSYDNVAGSIAARVREVGVSAAVGVPIIIEGCMWGLAAVGSLQPGPMPADTEVRIGRFAELIATVLVAGYRDEQKRQLLAEGSQRANLIDALLEGRAFDEWSLREVAGHLRLPIDGPFVVIAAQAPTVGGSLDARRRGVELSSPPRPFLTDRQRHCVLEVSATDLDHVVPLVRLGGDGLPQRTHLRKQPILDFQHRGDMHGGGDAVVGRLAHVHVALG
jgi:GAF domain